jgi:hypothetical protein
MPLIRAAGVPAMAAPYRPDGFHFDFSLYKKNQIALFATEAKMSMRAFVQAEFPRKPGL